MTENERPSENRETPERRGTPARRMTRAERQAIKVEDALRTLNYASRFSTRSESREMDRRRSYRKG